MSIRVLSGTQGVDTTAPTNGQPNLNPAFGLLAGDRLVAVIVVSGNSNVSVNSGVSALANFAPVVPVDGTILQLGSHNLSFMNFLIEVSRG